MEVTSRARWEGQLSQTGVAVEKLTRRKMAEKTLHYEALQTTFSIFLDIFYPPNFGCFGENGVFQQPRLITTVMKLGRIICIAGRLANRGDSNAQILTFALRDRYQYAVIGPINIR